MDLKKVLSFLPYPGNYLHPVVYACTAVMLLCLLVSMVTYMVHHSVIRINRKGWHVLLNFLFHTGLTFGVFAGGINQIHHPLVCQSVGMVLHYSSLSSMLWLMFTARNICHDVSKDALRAQNRNGKTKPEPSILRFYLISDGIPLIIVGVTAAFGLENYGSSSNTLYCWMAWEPSLGGFYSPVALLVLVMFVYFFCTYVQLKRHPEKKYELRFVSEEQQLSSCDTNHYCCTAAGPVAEPVGEGSAFAGGVSMLANEQSFKSQLRATAFTLFLYLSTWALGGLAVSQEPLLDMIFSCLYGAFCVSLGLFLLIQHCAKRDDVWHRWWVCCPSKSKSEDKDEGAQNRTLAIHQTNSHLGSPYSGKQHSPHLLQSSYHKVAIPSPGPPSPMAHTGPCCVAVISPVVPPTEPMSSPSPQPLPEELPRPVLPLQSCLIDRAKSHSFSRPRPCLQDFRTHLNSISMDGYVQSPRVDTPVHRFQRSKSPHPDLQLPFSCPPSEMLLGSCNSLQRQTSCHSVQDSMPSHQNHSPDVHDRIASCHSLHLPTHTLHTGQWSMCSGDPSSCPDCCCDQLEPYASQYRQEPDSYSCTPKAPAKDKNTLSVDVEHKGFPRNTLPRRHGAISLRDTITRNRSLQEDNFYGLDVSRSIRTGPWKNETSV